MRSLWNKIFLKVKSRRVDEEHKSSFSKIGSILNIIRSLLTGGETSFLLLLDHNNNGTLLNGMSSQE